MLASYTLGRPLAVDARYFALDSLGGAAWLADEIELVRLSLADPSQPPMRMRLPGHVTGLALNPLSGTVWVAQKETLLSFSRAGALLYSVDLEALGLRKPKSLAFDPVSRSLWVRTEKSVSRFSDSGQLEATFTADDHDEALGVPAFKVTPTLSVVRPPQDALTNNPRPEFRVGYGADCNGTACSFPGSYFGSYHLAATLNGEPVGAAFQFDASSIESSFTPSSRLPEGPNSFSAQAKDGFGHSSDTVSLSFTVDTIPPRFLAITPNDGSVFQTPTVAIQGTVDDAAATVVLEGSGLMQTGAKFSFPVTLQPGPNTFTLSAIDRAGNRSAVSLGLVLNTVAVEIQSPGSSSTLLGPAVAVSGTFQGPVNTGITANGEIAAIFGNRYFALVPVVIGSNTINVVATAPDGTKATQAITVMVIGNAPIRLDVRPAQGVAPFATSFRLTQAAGRPIVAIEADYDGDGTVDFTTTDPAAALTHTYAAPGVYAPRFNVKDDSGITRSLTQTVVVKDPADMDRLFQGMWTNLTQALAAGNKAAALRLFNPAAQAKFGPILDALLPNMSGILNSFSPLVPVSQSDAIAQYAIVRPNGAYYGVYLIYFVTDANGVWRLDEM